MSTLSASDLALAQAVALHLVEPEDQLRLDEIYSSSTLSAAFQGEVDDLREVLAAMSDATAASPPPTLRDAILTQVSSEAPQVHTARARTTPSLRWRPALAAAAVVLVALGAGIAIGRSFDDATRPGVSEIASDSIGLTAGVSTGGQVTALYSSSQRAVVLLANAFVQPPTDRVYQAWLIVGNTPRPAGLMKNLDSHGNATIRIDDAAAGATVALTVEPVGGSALPTSTPLVTLTLPV